MVRGWCRAKLDLKSAYRIVPVHPLDQHLLGIEWQGIQYWDQALPFGLRSATIIFTAVADGVAWALALQGITKFIHYLDDFFFCAPADSQACQRALDIAVPRCRELGLPVAPSKVEGPSNVMESKSIL